MKVNQNPKANRHILLLTYGVVGLFIGLAVYFGYFLSVKSENVINNSYNARLDSFAERVVRGEIRSSDGRVLARVPRRAGDRTVERFVEEKKGWILEKYLLQRKRSEKRIFVSERAN